MLAALLAAQFALVFAGSHGSIVELELVDNMKLPATYNQFTMSQVQHQTYSLEQQTYSRHAASDI